MIHKKIKKKKKKKQIKISKKQKKKKKKSVGGTWHYEYSILAAKIVNFHLQLI